MINYCGEEGKYELTIRINGKKMTRQKRKGEEEKELREVGVLEENPPCTGNCNCCSIFKRTNGIMYNTVAECFVLCVFLVHE